MTEAPPRSVDDSQPVAPLRVRRERPRFPLALKLFLLVALLIASVVATAVGVTLRRAGAIARETVNKSITNASHLFRELEENRYARLRLGVRPLASDPNFVAYIEDARTQVVEPPDGEAAAEPGPPVLKPEGIASVLDQLQSRREGIGSDLMMVTDAEGYLLGRSDQTNVTSHPADDLYESEPLLKELIDRGGTEPAIGVIATSGRLYHAVAMPLAVGPAWVPKGYVINALAIDEYFANRIAESTNASVVFVGAGDSPFASRSTDAPSIAALRGLADLAPMLESGKALTPRSVSIHGSAYVLTGGALQSGGRPLGAAIFVRSLDRELAPYREIEKTLWLAGGFSLLVALALSFLLASRVTKPISDLAAMAQAVTAGDYTVQPDIRRQDEVGILSASFATMVSALRDKEELERLYEQMAVRIREKDSSTQSVRRPPSAEEATVLVTELRGLAVSADAADAERVIAQIAQCVRLQETEVRRQEGQVREIVGQRVISTFDGERGAARAVRAARAIFEELATMQTDGSAPLTLACGVATGEFVTGTVTAEGVSGLAIAGNAPQLALLFASEAPTGHAFLALESAQSAGGDLAGASTREEVRLRWLPAPVSVHSLPLQGFATGTHGALMAAGTAATLVLEAGSSPRIPIRDELSPGALFASRYLIEQTLGRGGMGVVYKALDRQLEETVAIKTLPGDVMMGTPAELERFKREIRLARRITHRNVLRTYDYGEADGVYFISMEFVRGYTLAELMQQTQPVALRAALGISRQICRGLHAAHEQGIIHRDIKPQNVLIDSKGEVKLMDFGIARMSESAEAMTAAGLIVGTPHYMSPEQVQGKPVDTRSDVYSMGVVLYEMLCGVRPFDDASLTAVLAAHLTRPVRPPIELRAEVGDGVNSIVLRCLNKDPRHRYGDAGELLRDLDRVQRAI